MKWFVGLLLCFVGIFYLIMKKAPVAPPPEDKPPVVQAPPPPPVEPPIQQRMSPETLKNIRHMLADTDPKVRVAALDMLYNFNDPSVLQVISKMYQTETDPNVVISALGMIAKHKDKNGLPILLSALKNSNTQIQLEAIRDVTTFSNPDTIHPLTDLMNDEDENVRLASLKAVAQIQKDEEDRRRREEEERRRREQEEAERKRREKEG